MPAKAATATAEAPRAVTPAIQDQLREYMKATGLSNTEVGKKMGYADGTAVSRYLNGKPQGDIVKFEYRFFQLINAAENGDDRALKPVSRSEQARASSRNSRVNIPVNLDNYRDYDDETKRLVLWLHQHIMDAGLRYRDVCEALGVDQNEVWGLLMGAPKAAPATYHPKIESYKALIEKRAQIHGAQFAENSISKAIFAALDYALVNNTIALVMGESRLGKTCAIQEWQRRNNHGRSVYVEIPPVGGVRALLQAIAEAVGVNTALNTTKTFQAVCRAFNHNRILILDEARRLVPKGRTTEVPIETVRSIHDQTRCAVALCSTQRMAQELQQSRYLYEQLIGRISMPVVLPANLTPEDILPIVKQFLPNPRDTTTEVLLHLANQPGRLATVVETLKFAHRGAAKAKTPITDQHVLAAIKYRETAMGTKNLFTR